MSAAERKSSDSVGANRPDGFTIERLTVRPLVVADLPAVAPMITLATASGLVAPPPSTGDAQLAAAAAEVRDANESAGPDGPDAVEHDEYWLADHEGSIVGFALLHHVDRQRAAIRALWVDERYRRLGVGQRLLEGTVVHCQRAGYLKLVLELPFRLEKMVPLFGRLGFSFARSRAVSGTTILEFYLDLYRDPGI